MSQHEPPNLPEPPKEPTTDRPTLPEQPKEPVSLLPEPWVPRLRAPAAPYPKGPFFRWSKEEARTARLYWKWRFLGFFFPDTSDLYVFFLRQVCLMGLLAALLAAGIFGGALWLTLVSSPAIKTPSLLELDLLAALDHVDNKLWNIQIHSIFDDAPPYQVLSQRPKAGSTVRQGRTLILTVSRGPDVYTVPDLLGMQLEAAKTLLLSSNIPYTLEIVNQENMETNTILSQGFEPGTEVSYTAPIRLLANTPVHSTDFLVENYEGRSLMSLAEALYRARITPILQKKLVDSPSEDGLVLSQDVSAGSVIPKNSEITLEVGVYGSDSLEQSAYDYHVFRYYVSAATFEDAARKSVSAQSSPVITASSASNTNQVSLPTSLQARVDMMDGLSDTQTLYNNAITAGTYIIVPFKGFGKVQVHLFLNDELIQTLRY